MKPLLTPYLALHPLLLTSFSRSAHFRSFFSSSHSLPLSLHSFSLRSHFSLSLTQLFLPLRLLFLSFILFLFPLLPHSALSRSSLNLPLSRHSARRRGKANTTTTTTTRTSTSTSTPFTTTAAFHCPPRPDTHTLGVQ